MNEVEIVVSLTGKIPRRQFESYSPFFSVKELMPKGLSDEERSKRQAELHSQCEELFNKIRDRVILEEVQSQFKNLRFTLNPKDGRKYPHVTNILYWDAEFYMNPDELTQYGCRGTAIHRMIDNWITTKKWDKSVIAKKDKIILEKGSLKLWQTLDDINFLGFMDEYGKDIEFGEGEFLGFSSEHFYCGSPDRVGKFKGVPCVFDFKCRAAKEDDHKQTFAYSMMDDPRLKGISRSVIVPLNSSNESGFGKPVVSDEKEKYFNLFLHDRRDFKEKFGI